ncbi:MAG: hypothetical protein IMY67_03435 [Bacteroidetes bacterium]|nr:hypothetical protein [Bacteroidota bacterium]
MYIKETAKNKKSKPMESSEKLEWKSIYTIVLVANATYIILFYFLMKTFS